MKYIMLYNVELESEYDYQKTKEITTAIPQAIIQPFCIYRGEIHGGVDYNSIWIPEDTFLIAWTMFNYELLLDPEEWDTRITDAFDLLERHQKNEVYCMTIVDGSVV